MHGVRTAADSDSEAESALSSSRACWQKSSGYSLFLAISCRVSAASQFTMAFFTRASASASFRLIALSLSALPFCACAALLRAHTVSLRAHSGARSTPHALFTQDISRCAQRSSIYLNRLLMLCSQRLKVQQNNLFVQKRILSVWWMGLVKTHSCPQFQRFQRT